MADKTILDSTSKISSSATVLDTDTSTQTSLSLSTFRGGEIVEEFDAIGAEADVYLVEQDEHRYFLKLYRKGIHVNTDILESIYTLSQKYPYFAALKEYGFDENIGRYYELSEYLAEGNLSTIDKKSIEVDSFIKTMNEALHLLHQNNIIHRDLKPNNILLRNIDPQEIVLVDFGVSSVIQENMSMVLTTFKGTYAYAAPEVMSDYFGKEVDYWSLGMVLLELLDKNPLSGLDSNVILHTLATKNIDIPSSLNGRHRLLLKGLLTRDSKKRWGYTELKSWLEGRTPKTYYDISEENEDNSQKYKFKGQYYSKKELASVFVKGENFEDALKHIGRGYITKYLEKIEEFDEAIKLDEEYSTPLEKLIYYIYSQDKEMPFSLYGIVIDEDYLFGLLLKYIRNELEGYDENIYELLVSQEFVRLIEVYNVVTEKKNNLIEVIGSLPLSESGIYQYFDLKLAIRQNDLERIQRLLKLNPEIDEETLIRAIESNNKKIPELFLSFVKDKSVVTESVVTKAIQTTDKATIKTILELAPTITTVHYKELFQRGLGDILEKDALKTINGKKELLQVLLEQKEQALIKKYFDANDLYDIAKELLTYNDNADQILLILFQDLNVDVDRERRGISLLDIAIEASNNSLIDLVASYSNALSENNKFSSYIVSTDNITLYKKYQTFFTNEEILFRLAFNHESRKIVKYLIKKLKVRDTSLVFEFIYDMDMELLEAIVDNGVDFQVLNSKGDTPLFDAFKKKREVVSEYLLEVVDNVSSPIENREGRPLLWYAVHNKWYFAIDYLLNDEGYINKLNESGLSLEIIEKAIDQGDDIIISKLLMYISPTKVSKTLISYILEQDNIQYFRKFEKYLSNEEDILHEAVRSKSESIASYLLDNGINIEEETLFMAIRSGLRDVIETATCSSSTNYDFYSYQDGNSNTLLQVFAQKGWKDALMCLLKNSTPEVINHINSEEISLFDMLVKQEDIHLLIKLAEYTFFDELLINDDSLKELIIQYDQDQLYRVYKEKISGKYDLLYQVIKQKKKTLTTALLHENIKLDSRLLFLAIATDQLDIVTLLTEKGVDLDAAGKYEDTPIQYAILKDRKGIAEFLLSQDVNTGILDKDGNSLLHLAMIKGWYSIIERLSKLVSVDQKNNVGETPLLTYLKYSKAISKSVIDLLLKSGARIDTVDNKGTSVEDLAKNVVSILQAAKNRDELRIELLLERGGNINKALHQFVDEYILERK